MRKGFLLAWMLIVSIILVYVLYEPELPTTIHDVYTSVVYVEAGDDAGYWSGSGVVVDQRGIILTAGHMLEDADFVIVHFADGTVRESVDWCIDPNNDVGIVQIIDFSGELNVSKLTTDVVLGQQVFLIGSPLGKMYFNTISVGYLSKFDVFDSYYGSDLLFQLDGAANPGNSGCPAFNMKGEIVGIIIGGWMQYESMNYMTTADTCIEFVKQYVESNS